MSAFRHLQFPHPLRLAVSALIGCAGTLVLLRTIHFVLWPSPSDAYDFRTLWIAGKLWASGQNPYSDAFTSEYLTRFGPIGPADFFNYPPYWFPILAALSLLPFTTSFVVWEVFNLGLLILATFLTARIFARENRAHTLIVFLGGFGLVAVMQTTGWALSDGQTSILLYFGLAAVFYGISRKRTGILSLGLIAIALKPNVGVVIYLIVAILPKWRITVISVFCLLMLAAAPVLLTDPLGTVSGLLTNLGRYHGYKITPATPHEILVSPWTRLHNNDWIELIPNSPVLMIGVFHFTGAFPSGFVTKLLVMIAAVASVVAYRLSSSDELRLVRITIIIVLFVPLHSYDAIIVAIPLLFIWSRGTIHRTMTPALLGLLICIRPGNLTRALDIMHGSIGQPYGTLLTSIGLFLIAVPFLTPMQRFLAAEPAKIPEREASEHLPA